MSSGIAEVFARLRGPSVIGCSIYLVFEIVEASIPSDNSMLRDIVDVTKDVLLLPFYIAICRLLILGESTSQYSFWIFIPRFQRLLGWTIGLWAVINLPPHVVNLITSSHAINPIATIVFMVLGVMLTIRITILFPAIAVGATLQSALADTSGRSWLILKAYFLVFLPLLLATMVLAAWRDTIGDVYDLSDWSALPRILLMGSIGFLTDAASAVMAARLFDWIGDREGRGSKPGRVSVIKLERSVRWSMSPGQTFERGFLFTCEPRTAHGSEQRCSRKHYRQWERWAEALRGRCSSTSGPHLSNPP